MKPETVDKDPVAEALAALKLATSRRGAYASPGAKAYSGLLKDFAPRSG